MYFIMQNSRILKEALIKQVRVKKKKQIDCKAGSTAKGQNLLANISTNRASLLQGQYNVKLTALKFE